MRKLLLGTILSLSIISCQTKEEKLISDCESNLIKQLKDPSSYERIDAKIVDTITSLDRYTDEVKYAENSVIDTLAYTETLAGELENLYVKESKIRLDSVKISKNPNRVLEIIVRFEYRAKNSFGALDIQKSDVEFLPEPSYFKKGENEKYLIYSGK